MACAARIEKGAVPVPIDADNGVVGGVEDLLQLTDGDVAERFGGLAVGDVAVVKGNAIVDGEDVDVDPEVERRIEVLDVLSDACLHDVAIGTLDLGSDGVRKELPMGFVVDVGGKNAADAHGFSVRVGDDPVGVEAEDGIGYLGEQIGRGGFARRRLSWRNGTARIGRGRRVVDERVGHGNDCTE